MTNASRDNNRVPTLLGVSSLDLSTPTTIAVNPATGAMLIDSPSLYVSTDARYLKLDQADPQTIENGVPLMTTPVDEDGSGDQLVNKGYCDDAHWFIPPIITWWDPTGGLPDDPHVGDRYGADATANDWTEGYIYEWDGEGWVESEPEEGWFLFDLIDYILWEFISGFWLEVESSSYWIVDEDQIDITGDKTGSFDLTTTGTGTFSQVLTPEIKTDTTTPTDLTVTTGAAKTLVLATSVFDDLQFQVSNAKVTPNNLLPSWEAFTTNTSEYAFSVNDEVDTQANEIPHWWKEGTAGNAHLHITTKGVPAQEQKAQFTVTFAYADTNEVWVEAPFTAELTIPISTTALTNFYLDLGNLTLTNYLIGAQIRCRIKRVAKSAGGTEYVGDIFITQCGIHLEKTRMGSRNEITS